MPARPIPAAPPDAVPEPIDASGDELAIVLDHQPVLWVGAGVSLAAGYPSTWKLVETMNAQVGGKLDPTKPFFTVADDFVKRTSPGRLNNLLQRLFAEPRSPTPVHRAVAKLAKGGRLHAIVTTNYDPLIEDALRDAGVPCVAQKLEQNAAVTGSGEIRVLKIHGSYDDWRKIVLSGRSYATFTEIYGFLNAQLDVLLRQRPVLFLGCSLQDPRILDWLAKIPDDWADSLEVWRALMLRKDWDAALGCTWEGGHASGALARGRVRPLILENHGELATLLGEAAADVAEPSPRIAIDLHTGDTLRASLEGCPDWATGDPLADPALVQSAAELRALDHDPVPTDDHGRLAPAAASATAAIRALAERVGLALTTRLLSPEAVARLSAAVRGTTGGAPPFVVVRVHASGGAEARRRADWLLSLPWELLVLDGEHPVEHGKLDLAREAVIDGAPGLRPPIASSRLSPRSRHRSTR